MNTPLPREWETRAEYLDRFVKHTAAVTTYPNATLRRAAGEAQWAKAKSECLVSITTDAAEVLLFD